MSHESRAGGRLAFIEHSKRCTSPGRQSGRPCTRAMLGRSSLASASEEKRAAIRMGPFRGIGRRGPLPGNSNPANFPAPPYR